MRPSKSNLGCLVLGFQRRGFSGLFLGFSGEIIVVVSGLLVCTVVGVSTNSNSGAGWTSIISSDIFFFKLSTF